MKVHFFASVMYWYSLNEVLHEYKALLSLVQMPYHGPIHLLLSYQQLLVPTKSIWFYFPLARAPLVVKQLMSFRWPHDYGFYWYLG